MAFPLGHRELCVEGLEGKTLQRQWDISSTWATTDGHCILTQPATVLLITHLSPRSEILTEASCLRNQRIATAKGSIKQSTPHMLIITDDGETSQVFLRHLGSTFNLLKFSSENWILHVFWVCLSRLPHILPSFLIYFIILIFAQISLVWKASVVHWMASPQTHILKS